MTAKTATAARDGMNSAVSYKWLISIIGPLAVAIVWAMAAMIAPVKQRTDANAGRINRQEQRTQQQLERIEQKVDRLLERKP